MRGDKNFCTGKPLNAKVISPLISVDDLLSLNSAHIHKHNHFAWTTVAASEMRVFERIQLRPSAIGILIHNRVLISARWAKTVRKFGYFRFWIDSFWGRLMEGICDYKVDAEAFNQQVSISLMLIQETILFTRLIPVISSFLLLQLRKD